MVRGGMRGLDRRAGSLLSAPLAARGRVGSGPHALIAPLAGASAVPPPPSAAAGCFPGGIQPFKLFLKPVRVL